MVLLIRKLPCTASGKRRLEISDRPDVGRTRWRSANRSNDLCVATPYLGVTVPGIIQRTSGLDVSAKKFWPHSSNVIPHGLGIDSCAVLSPCRRCGLSREKQPLF